MAAARDRGGRQRFALRSDQPRASTMVTNPIVSRPQRW